MAMRERTVEEKNLLRVGWIQQALDEALYGRTPMSLYEYVIEYSLEGEERPSWHQQYPRWRFDECSITEDELHTLLDEIIERLRINDLRRDQTISNLQERVYHQRKESE